MSADTPPHWDGPPEALQAAAADLVLIRRADADDAPFIFSYWLRDGFEHTQFAKGIAKDDYMRFQHLLVERIIARSCIWVACDAEDPTVCYGFICVEGKILHNWFVKRRFRRLGIGVRLLAAAGIPAGPEAFTHLTDMGVGLRRKFPLARYLPWHV